MKRLAIVALHAETFIDHARARSVDPQYEQFSTLMRGNPGPHLQVRVSVDPVGSDAMQGRLWMLSLQMAVLVAAVLAVLLLLSAPAWAGSRVVLIDAASGRTELPDPLGFVSPSVQSRSARQTRTPNRFAAGPGLPIRVTNFESVQVPFIHGGALLSPPVVPEREDRAECLRLVPIASYSDSSVTGHTMLLSSTDVKPRETSS